MKYIEGYVAFIDILGFSDFVSEEANVDRVKNLFDFVEAFQTFLNSSDKLEINIAFFSDSIVLTSQKNSEGLKTILYITWIIEQILSVYTGLYVRGGITKGLYYHDNSIAFGPAIVNSYKLENEAKYSRILVDNDVVECANRISSLLMLQDNDGKYYLNPYSTGILSVMQSDENLTKKQIVNLLKSQRKHICNTINNNLKKACIEKYLWRILPFNKTCEMISLFLDENKITYDNKDIESCNSLKISINEFE